MPTLPSVIGGWSATRVPAGLWLAEAPGPVPRQVFGLAAEAGRPSMVVHADAPSPRTDQLISELFPVLASAGLAAVRLVLSSAADVYGPVARAHGLDLVAAEAEVTITPHGYAVVRPAGPVAPVGIPQWRRFLPSGDSMPAGLLSPTPDWERGLEDELGAGLEPRLTVRRVPAGVAVRAAGSAGPATEFVRAAGAVWPDPERLLIVVDETGEPEALLEGLTGLLRQLPRASAAGVRLWWPRAVARLGSAALQDMARRCETSLIAPSADVSVNDHYGGLCHSPAGAAPWLWFTLDDAPQLLGSLYPEPGWERALTDVELTTTPGLVVEHVASGLCVYRPDGSPPSLVATARSVIPDAARATIIIGGDVMSAEVRQDLEAVVRQLPEAARQSLRIALTSAGSGGQESYAQALADTFGCLIVAPEQSWTATPDGRLLARVAPGASRRRRQASDGWREFSPRDLPRTAAPADTAGAAAQAVPLRHPEQPARLRGPGVEPAAAAPGQPTAPLPGPAPPRPAASGPGPVPREPAASGHPPRARHPVVPRSGTPQSGGAVTQPGPVSAEPGAPPPVPGQPAAPGPGAGEPAASRPGPAQPGGTTASRPGRRPGAAEPGAPPPGPGQPPGPRLSAQPGVTGPTSHHSGTPAHAPGGASPTDEPAGRSPDRRASPDDDQAAPGQDVGGSPVPEPETPGPERSPRRLVLLPRDHRSSAEERRLYRESAHSYQAHAILVRRMLTQRPGLRAVAAGEPVDAVITDFSALLDFLGDDPTTVADALRSAGTAGDPRVACVLSGLRRLPSFAGAVFSSARSNGGIAAAYVPCRILIEPSFISATSSVVVALEGDITYVIWSQTGKRVAALAADAGRDEILFAAGTAYKVLGVYPGKPGSPQVRVFLRELAGTRETDWRRGAFDGSPLLDPHAANQPDDMDNKVLERLTTAASLRDDALADNNVEITRTGRPMPPIGLDASGIPFAEAASA